MTASREWANNAKEARDRSAEEACKAIRLLEPILERSDMTREELLLRVAKALNASQTIARLLEKVGAQTQP
jgi:hypothetical protein